MQHSKALTTAIGAAMMMIYGAAQAAPFASFDPRTMAMGGAGVAVGNAGSAPFFNPALLAVTAAEDDFALELPIIGARFYDPDDFTDAMDNFQDSTVMEDLDAAIAAFNAAPGDTTAMRSALSDLDGELIKLGSKPLQGELGAAMVVGIPSKKFGVAFSASGSATFGGIVNYKDSPIFATLDNDLATLQGCIDALDYTNCQSLTYVDGSGNVTFGTAADVASSVDVRGLILREVALSFSREVELGGQTFAVGVTPKYVNATVLDYSANVETSDDDDFDGDDYTYDYSHFNMDLGIAKDYANGWRTGFVVKNLLSQTYDTYRMNTATGQKEKTGNSIKTSPQARIGVSHQGKLYTLAADIDLTANDPIGYEGKSRYVALGAEFNAWDWAQLRVGYRANTEDSNRNVWSAGIGLSPFGAHFDLAVSGNADEVGASMQLGFRF